MELFTSPPPATQLLEVVDSVVDDGLEAVGEALFEMAERPPWPKCVKMFNDRGEKKGQKV